MTNKNGPGPSTVQPLYEQKHSPNKTHYRTAYGPRQRLSIAFPETGRTKQEFKNECDINTIMARFDKTGILAFTNRFQPQYGDTTGIEFQNSMETIAAGRSMFQELPSAVRARFQNDPARFLDFVHDERNLDEMREMGLLRPSDAEAAPLPDPSGERSHGPEKALPEDSKSRGGLSELDRGAGGPAKSDRRSEKTA